MPPRCAALLLAATLMASPGSTNEPPALPRLPRAPATPAEAATLFAGLPPIPLRQAWREAPEAAHAPGRVWFARDEKHLLVFAELEDADIHSEAAAYNDFLFLRGDVFELFVQPEGGAPYWEIHVNPAGVSYQARFPSAEEFAARRGRFDLEELLAPYTLPRPCARVQAWVDRPAGRWHALVEVPWEALGFPAAVRLSAARYDATRGRVEPVLSCTAPLQKLNFHRVEDWPVSATGLPSPPESPSSDRR